MGVTFNENCLLRDQKVSSSPLNFAKRLYEPPLNPFGLAVQYTAKFPLLSVVVLASVLVRSYGESYCMNINLFGSGVLLSDVLVPDYVVWASGLVWYGVSNNTGQVMLAQVTVGGLPLSK